MKIYLASRYGRRLELVGYANRLQGLGHVVTSSWLLGTHEIHDTCPSLALGAQFAREDQVDLMGSDMMISFTEAPNSPHSRGGRHVEFGMALSARKKCVVIGYRENVFHYLPEVLFYDDWDAFMKQFIIGWL